MSEGQKSLESKMESSISFSLKFVLCRAVQNIVFFFF